MANTYLHHILGQGSCFVRKHVVNLAKLLRQVRRSRHGWCVCLFVVHEHILEIGAGEHSVSQRYTEHVAVMEAAQNYGVVRLSPHDSPTQ